jgi:hypothetical protein
VFKAGVQESIDPFHCEGAECHMAARTGNHLSAFSEIEQRYHQQARQEQQETTGHIQPEKKVTMAFHCNAFPTHISFDYWLNISSRPEAIASPTDASSPDLSAGIERLP